MKDLNYDSVIEDGDFTFRHSVRWTGNDGRPYGHDYTIPPKDAKELAEIAAVFGMSLPEFLDAQGNLPGQPDGELIELPMVEINISGPYKEMFEGIAAFMGDSLSQYALAGIESHFRGDVGEIIWDPKTKKPLCWKYRVQDFCQVIGLTAEPL